MQLSTADIQISTRLANYSEEKTKIQRKLNNPQVPSEKKAKLQSRLHDIENRLIPETVRRMN